MSLKREYRTFKNLETRAKADGKGLIGLAAVFNSLSEVLCGSAERFQERCMPGCFDRSLASAPDVRCTFNHNPDLLLGRTKSGTLRLSVLPGGLQYDCDTPETQIGRDIVTSVARGDIDGSSFGFTVPVRGQNWIEGVDEDGEPYTIRELTDVDVFDVAPVTFPAYSATSASLRSLWPDGVPEEIESRAKKTKKAAGEDLTAGCFLIVGDPQDTETWKLPWKFSSEEKTVSHLRNALARFNQLEGVSKEDKDQAWMKLVSLCKKHGIEVSEENSLPADSGNCRVERLDAIKIRFDL